MNSTRSESSSSAPSREQVIGQGIAWTALWSLRWLVIAAAAVLVGILVGKLWGILLPIILALILTTLLEPLARVLRDRLHLPRVLSAVVTLFGSLALLVLVFALIAPSVAGQVNEIARSASAGLQQIQDWLQKNNFVTRDQLETAIEALQDRLQSSASSIASGVLVGVSAVASGLITLLLTVVLTFFFLKDGHRFIPWAAHVGGPSSGVHVAEVLRRIWQVLGGFIRAQALVGAADGILIGTGLLIMGVPAAIPLAVLTFFGGFVPIIGAVVVGAIAVLVALVSNGWVGALIVLALILVVQQVEGNILQPILQGKTMNLHAAVILLAVTLGSTLFGIVGAFLAVPVVAVLAAVLRYLDEVADREVLPPEAAAQPPEEEQDEETPVSDADPSPAG